MATDSTSVQTRATLKGSPMFSSFAVKDLEAARRFYGETLGVDVRDNREMGIFEIHGASGRPVMVYPKPDHRPAVFTVLNFEVQDIESAVDALTAAGVRMQQYDGQDGPKTDARGIVRDDNGPAIAWFTDPSGNIVSVLQTNR
jgi:predicted enzyme related to lactoylglutathione lyase